MKQARDIGVATCARAIRPLLIEWGFGTVTEALAHIADEYGDETEEDREQFDKFRDALRRLETA